MGVFDGVLICTDLDGTLLNSNREVSQKNKEAIKYFESQGGLFTFVTGRMPFFVDGIYAQVMPNAPFGCVNGGGLYDFESKKYIYKNPLSENVIELVQYVEQNILDIGIQVNTFNNTYFCKNNDCMVKFREHTGLPNLECGYSDVTEPIAKIVFGSSSESDIKKVESLLKAHPKSKDYQLIQSEKTLYEILPKTSGKGAAITALADYFKSDVKKIIAVGDYYNDISMFEAADVAVAVANARSEVIAAADYVTVSNNDNAIAKIIYDIQDGKV